MEIMKVYPYPEPQNLLGIFTHEKEGLKPIVGLDIYSKTLKQSLRVGFFYDSQQYQLQYNRLFTDDDMELYQNLDRECQADLLWFWKQDSFAIGQDRERLNRYYSILYRVYYGVMGMIEPVQKASFDKEFPSYWEYEQNEIKRYPVDLNASDPLWVQCYWRSYWKEFKYNGPWSVNMDDEAQWLDERIKAIQKRKSIISGIEKSGKGFGDRIRRYPSWFQGLDYTPKNSRGEDMEFIGQFWTDDMGYSPSKLLYLFFCPIDRVSVQVYDYD